jgi:Tol biopolymer transport system component
VAYNPGGARFVAASSDLSHVLFSSPVAWPGDEAYGAAGGSLYEYIVGQGGPPVPVGVEPDGAPCAASYHGDGVSADGSTVIFACGGQIFARIDNGEAGARTVAISAPSKADCSACNTAEIEQIPVERTKLQQEKGKGEITEEKYNEEVERLEGLSANFVGDSADGSKVFFTTKNPLLGNDTSNNIYEYDLEPGAGEEHVVRVSAGDWGPGGAQAQGAEVSEDGSHVYFDATGALSGVSNSQGKVPIEDKTNIYVYERDAQFPSGRIAFIATEGGIGPMTPDGQFMVFTSSTDLTPGDTSKAGQVFEYDAQTGELVRCSIGQDGFNDNGNTDTLRAALPGEVGSGPIPQAVGPVAVSDNGAYVVFQSADGLTPAALNGVTTNRINSEGGEEPIAINNVYEYHAGNVYLISDGKDTSILDGSFSTVDVDGMSPSGDDIFFDTADSLVPQDVDTGPDLYDARIDGGFPAPVSLLPSCQGDACQGELSPSPVLLSPGSEFQAGGNPPLSESAPAAKPRPEVKAKRCRRGYVNKNGRCVRKLKAKKAKAKKASNNRRAGS